MASPGPRGTLEGHAGAVLALAFSPGGRYCLSGGKDRTIRLWNPHHCLDGGDASRHARALIQTYGRDAHAREVRAVACSDDSARLASCGGDRQVFLHDVATGRVLRRMRGHDAPTVNTVAFAAGDSVVVSGGYDATVRLWDMRSNSIDAIQVLRQFKDSVTAVCVDGPAVIAASVDGCVRTFDVRLGRVTTDAFGPPVTSIALSSDRQCLLAGLLDDRLALLDRAEGTMLRSYCGHKSQGVRLGACFTDDDAHVVSGSEDGRVVLWDLVGGDVVASVDAAGGMAAASPVHAVAWHPNGACMLTAAGSGPVLVWDANRLA